MAWFVKRNPIIQRVHNVLLEKGFEGAWINKVYKEGEIMYMHLHLPEAKDYSELDKILPNLQQEVGATAVKYGKRSGKYVELLFGMRELHTINFDKSLLHPDSLQVEFPSAYGKHIIDFADGASCHMLNGGVTRMGKTCFLLYLATCIYLQNNGEVELYISSAKLKDYYPFEGLKGVWMEKDVDGFEKMLDAIIDMYKERNDLLYSPQFRKATDAKSIKKLYPESYHLFKPIFLIVDEYARFAETTAIQKKVTEIVETAGFVNVHVIIASQRPDATTVLKPRIRANLLCRLAFTTADKKNSEVILDREGAEKLGKIAGRGLLVDSDSHVIQIPYIEAPECDKLLEGYRNVKDQEGYNHTECTEKFQSVFAQSVSMVNMQGEQQPSQCSEQSIKKDAHGREDSTNT